MESDLPRRCNRAAWLCSFAIALLPAFSRSQPVTAVQQQIHLIQQQLEMNLAAQHATPPPTTQQMTGLRELERALRERLAALQATSNARKP